MARPKTRATGFTRFFLFMLIALPLIYFGVSYARGEDGMANLKNMFNSESTTTTITTPSGDTDDVIDLSSQLEKMTEERDYWRGRAEALEQRLQQQENGQ